MYLNIKSYICLYIVDTPKIDNQQHTGEKIISEKGRVRNGNSFIVMRKGEATRFHAFRANKG